MLDNFKKIGDYVGKFTKAICWVSFVGLIVLILLNVADVALAKIANKPILGAYEITQRVLLVTVFASFAYAQTTRAHINMTILIAVFPRALRFFCYTLMSLLSIVAAGALAYAAYAQGGVSLSSGTATEVLYIPLYPFFYIQALAMLAFAVALLYDFVGSAIAIFRKDFAEYLMTQWTD